MAALTSHEWAKFLSQSRALTASDAIRCDDAVAYALFGQRNERPFPRAHTLARLSARPEDVVSREFADELQSAFERNKAEVFVECRSAAEFCNRISRLIDMSDWARRAMPSTRNRQSSRALTWCFQAHLVLLDPSAPIKLKLIKFGELESNQFGVVAKRYIQRDAAIPQLIGQLSIDNVDGLAKDKTTQLSEIKARDGTARTLYGPIRFVNHHCHPNAVFEEIRRGCHNTIIIKTVRDIEEGEEVTVDYGGDFFAERGDCRCQQCCPSVAKMGGTAKVSGMRVIDGEKKQQALNRRNKKRREARAAKFGGGGGRAV
ncbi:hypothetical protein R3P38DRAFT_3231301 [Favolaschia claudopus]|uniref:SET domain-containing protein n=1 Tax=Favolaschia claudopus TaxID=2862362 RepID=A0AAV9ZKV3_9AGAR